jgi:hypothetical protein
LATPNTVVISQVTAHLLRDAFVLEALGTHELKGVAEPMQVFRADRLREVDAEDIATVGFEALVGRDEEIGLLLRRWGQSKEGLGQVVLISGEVGIGKSSLVEGLRQHVRQEGVTGCRGLRAHGLAHFLAFGLFIRFRLVHLLQLGFNGFANILPIHVGHTQESYAHPSIQKVGFGGAHVRPDDLQGRLYGFALGRFDAQTGGFLA